MKLRRSATSAVQLGRNETGDPDYYLGRSIGRAMYVLATASVAGCSSFVASDRLPGTDGAYYALPRAYVPISISRTGCDLEAKAADAEYVPDLSAQYRLRLDHGWFSKDKLEVVTDTDGLLSKVNGKSTDQTSAFVKGAVRLAAQINFRAGAGSPFSSTGTDKQPFDCSKSGAGDFTYEATVDPLSTKDQLKSLAFELRGTGVTIDAYPLEESVAKAAPSVDCAEVVCFRVLRPYVVSVEQAKTSPEDGNFKEQTYRFMVLAPDPNWLMGVRLDRQLLSEADIQLSFDRGVLTKYHATKHSEVGSLLQLPLDVGAEVLSLPSQLTAVRVEEIKSETNLLEGQKSLLEAQAALIAAQKAALEAGKKPPQDSKPDSKE